MPGIVTSTNESGSVKTYRVQFTSTSTSLAINWVTGTTASSTGNNVAADKGVFLMFQNQSTGVNVTVGGPSVTPGVQGIILGPLTTSATNNASVYQVFSASGSFSGMQMNDWYVCATSSAAMAVAQLVKGV